MYIFDIEIMIICEAVLLTSYTIIIQHIDMNVAGILKNEEPIRKIKLKNEIFFMQPPPFLYY